MILVWTEPALLDLETLRDYIAKDSAYYAQYFTERIIEAVERLIEFPQIGWLVPEFENPDLRELWVQSYRIIYRVQADRTEIIAVLHQSRDLSRFTWKPWEI